MDWERPDPARLFRAMDATWAPASRREQGGWMLREGQGGGKRVSAATPLGAGADWAAAAAAMRAMGQAPLFMIREQDVALDRALADEGYRLVDPVTLLAAPTGRILAQAVPPHPVLFGDMALTIMAEIWDAGGIGPARLAVMGRVAVPKTFLFARSGDQPAAVGFAAAADGIAMLHAVEVAPAHRRHGLGRALVAAAARWAGSVGAGTLALATVRENAAGNALFRAMGMEPAAEYHYRLAES